MRIRDTLSLTSSHWQPEVVDLRDFTLNHTRVQATAALAPHREQNVESQTLDLRELFPTVDREPPLVGPTAVACTTLVEYLERRASGTSTRLSSQFVWEAAQRMQPGGVTGTRVVLKTIARLGVPPLRIAAQSKSDKGNSLLLDPFLYSFPFATRPVYFRLDGPRIHGDVTISRIRSTLLAGIPVVIGFTVPESITSASEIPYRPMLDNVVGGQAALIVGYDDRMASSTVGAFLIRTSWGREWGEDGYGWLPYQYVREGLASDVWTLISDEWMSSGEFFNPCVSELRLVGPDRQDCDPISSVPPP